jgi:LPPG:FO 2-phospho-L-lactate transferase
MAHPLGQGRRVGRPRPSVAFCRGFVKFFVEVFVDLLAGSIVRSQGPPGACERRSDRWEEVSMVVVLAGGVGAARFLRGLVNVVPAEDITVVVNVGDDLDHLGLRICPDLDSITYWLAGLVHPSQQWGRADERFTVRDELERLGHETWFTLGDRDLALHLHRTAGLQQGIPLSQVTADVTRRHGLDLRLLPASDDRIETRIHTVDGRDLHFQEWWIREQAGPDVARVEYRGADTASAAPGLVESIRDADVVVIAPSNPVVSIAPIVAVPAIAAALATTAAPIVGISPIVAGQVVRGMAHRLLPAVGVGVDALGVAGWYGTRQHGGLLDAWVIDDADAAMLTPIRALGLGATATATLMDDAPIATALARTTLDLVSRVR